MQQVTFSSFQMAARANSSEPIGTLRYKSQNGKYLTVLPGVVGQRFLLPQIEHWGLQAPQQVQQSAQCPVNTSAGVQAQQAADQPPSSAQRPSEVHLRQKRQRTEAQADARRAKVNMARVAREMLINNPQWCKQATAVFSNSSVEWEGFNLNRHARCNAFGLDQYASLKNVTFYRCCSCGIVLSARKQTKAHKCSSTQSRPRRRRTADVLPGGTQLVASPTSHQLHELLHFFYKRPPK